MVMRLASREGVGELIAQIDAREGRVGLEVLQLVGVDVEQRKAGAPELARGHGGKIGGVARAEKGRAAFARVRRARDHRDQEPVVERPGLPPEGSCAESPVSGLA
jgi:hypothetical protein